MSDLLPCPFCGGKPYTRETQDEDLSTHAIVTWRFVGCHNCDVSFGIPDGYDCGTAKEQWNTRAALEPVTVQEAARVALERFESCASKMVPDEYAKGYREACEHIRALAERGE